MSSINQQKIKKLKKMNLSGKIDWEIDYSILDYYLEDKNGQKNKPFLFIIVHPESNFVVKMHLVSSTDDYLSDFLFQLLDSLEKSEFYPKRILVKKDDLSDLFNNVLKDLNIDLEIVKRTRAIEYIKRESNRFLK